MNERAAHIQLSLSQKWIKAAAISVELRNPLVISILYRNGFSNLYKSVSMAFSVLPGIIEKPEKNYDIPQLWVVRERILREVRDRWHIPEQNVVHAANADMEQLHQRIKELNDKRSR